MSNIINSINIEPKGLISKIKNFRQELEELNTNEDMVTLNGIDNRKDLDVLQEEIKALSEYALRMKKDAENKYKQIVYSEYGTSLAKNVCDGNFSTYTDQMASLNSIISSQETTKEEKTLASLAVNITSQELLSRNSRKICSSAVLKTIADRENGPLSRVISKIASDSMYEITYFLDHNAISVHHKILSEAFNTILSDPDITDEAKSVAREGLNILKYNNGNLHRSEAMTDVLEKLLGEDTTYKRLANSFTEPPEIYERHSPLDFV